MSRPPTRKQITTPDGDTLTVWQDRAAGETMPQMFWKAVRDRGKRPAVAERVDGAWHTLSWAGLGQRVRHVGLGLKDRGFGRHDVAAIVAGNRADWLAADMAIQAVAGVSVGIDPEADAGTVRRQLRALGCTLAFVEDADRLAALRAAGADLPAVLLDGEDAAAVGLDELMGRGAQYDRDHLGQWEQLIDLARAHERAIVCCQQEHTVAFTHESLLFQCVNGSRALGIEAGDERSAVLPLSDVRERIVGTYYAIYAGAVSRYGADAPPERDGPRIWGPAAAGGMALVDGRPVPYGEARLSGSGEILLRGRHLSLDAASADGWLHTGTVGRIADDGTVIVTDEAS